MWTTYRVRMEFLTKLCGGVPANPDLQKRWLEARKPENRPPQSKSIDEIASEVYETTTAAGVATEEMTLHVFQRHGGALAVGMRTVRGHIKDISTVLSSLYVGKIAGERSFAVRVKNAVYYPPEVYWIPVLDARTGKPIMEPTGRYDKAIHMMTPQGPRSAIKTLEYVEGAAIEFPLLVMTQPSGKLVVSEADLKTVFTYGGTHGYGPERGDGEGRYAFTLKQDDGEAKRREAGRRK